MRGHRPPPRAPLAPPLVSPGRGVATSGSDAGRAKPARLPRAACRKPLDDGKLRPRDAGKDELSDAIAGVERDDAVVARRVTVPGRDQAGALVVGVDDPDRMAEHQPRAVTETRARQYQRAPLRVADAKGDPGRDQHRRRLRLQRERPVETGVQVEPGGKARSVAGETPTGQTLIED